MSKEQESFDRIKLFIVHMNDDFDSEDVSAVDNALNRLEAIDNANPSEALKCVESIEADLTGLPKHVTEYDECFDSYLEDIWDSIDTIKQALLKAQEPKQYLKWEDLEKFKDKDSVKVKMNDTELSLIIQIDCLNDIYVQLYKEKEDGNCVNLLSDFFRNKELFNNLRLELLE